MCLLRPNVDISLRHVAFSLRLSHQHFDDHSFPAVASGDSLVRRQSVTLGSRRRCQRILNLRFSQRLCNAVLTKRVKPEQNPKKRNLDKEAGTKQVELYIVSN